MSDSLEYFVGGALQELDLGESMGEQPGLVIGHYKLVRCLGQGGFGAVWLAEQSQPVRREVALKIIKLGMDTREVTARFELERQALAVMDHPGIAKVFDAGATPSGRPYFVMELVRGEPVTRHCDARTLSLSERLELFIEVCHAVQHAHQKGVIHRDLKPSNILVAEMGNEVVPKVIDFGIAKATAGGRLIEQTLVTRADRLMGTPAYMSPEQSEGGLGVDIDTRTDIYSLGVVLYELVTGQVPWERKDAKSRDVKRPSTVLRSLHREELKKIATARQTEAARLIGQVRSDLDWIVVKALEQDRERRYDSADALAADLLAFLEHRPVTARPPTAWYLMRRFARRNRVATVATAVVVLALLAGVTASTLMYLRAQQELERSRQVTQFLKDTLGHARASKSLGRDSTMMLEILDQTAKRVGQDLKNQPRVEAELRAVISQAYLDLGYYDQAHEQSAAALELERSFGMSDRPSLAEALHFGALHLHEFGKPKEAEQQMREALEMKQRLYGERDHRTLSTQVELGWILMRWGRAREAEPEARMAFEQWRKYPDDPLLHLSPNLMAAILHHLKRHEESLEVVKEHLAALRKLYGNEHPTVANCLGNLGMQYCRMERFDEAAAPFEEAMRQEAKFFKAERRPNLWYLLRGMQRVEGGRKNWEAQMRYAREAFDEVKKFHPAGHQHYQWTAEDLGKVLLEHAERAVVDDPQLCLVYVDELLRAEDFAGVVKGASGWVDCVRAEAMAVVHADRREEAQEIFARGIAALRAKSKSKPADVDKRRLIKAEAMNLAKVLTVPKT
ncbi:tetratricopeptide repeat protein [Phragmitibacter flavus]|uniref:Tetratricopeptide repeat protein n=1 Tax=Phragmitibacter flavus TaxID=2576071 RepID=A0A5R8KKV0_9BACT|nr:serine/threonine-protein kinase [Phragmitibacter flavus]TLD72595.1 tetratricopeptide repeat protein [Phragmitibacter flavus]